MEVALLYLLFINIIAVGATVSDKYNAVHRRRKQRVPESTLLAFAVLGGCISMYITMLIIRHKTKKPKFMITLPIIIMLEVALVFVLKYQGVF